jgi:hypothetical protein
VLTAPVRAGPWAGSCCRAPRPVAVGSRQAVQQPQRPSTPTRRARTLDVALKLRGVPDIQLVLVLARRLNGRDYKVPLGFLLGHRELLCVEQRESCKQTAVDEAVSNARSQGGGTLDQGVWSGGTVLLLRARAFWSFSPHKPAAL